MKQLANKLWERYKQWPWWKRGLGIAVLILIVLLSILSLLRKRTIHDSTLTEIDAYQDTKTNEGLTELQNTEQTLKEAIERKKEEITQRLEIASNIDEKSSERRKELLEAKTMDDLDRLQSKWGL